MTDGGSNVVKAFRDDMTEFAVQEVDEEETDETGGSIEVEEGEDAEATLE